MKKLSTLVALFLLCSNALFAQVGINNNNSAPDVSAMLDVKSTLKGMLAPRMTAAQRDAISTPATGLLIYCTDNNQFYSNKGTPSVPDWEMISSQWISSGSNIYYSAGNVGIGTSNPAGKLHVNDPASSNPMVMVTPMATGSADSASLLLAEDHDGTYGMYWMYDGVDNQLELWGKSGTAKLGPHILVDRTNGDIAFGSTIASGYKLSVNGSAWLTQAGINADNSAPNGSAILDVKSTTKGFLPPRMTKTQRNSIGSPATGLVIYQTDNTPGIYYFSGNNWVCLPGSGPGGNSPSMCIDYDGNAYPTFTIGTQTWMAENLRVTHYRNGEGIPNVTNNGAWGALSTGAYCWYANDQTANAKYGAMYNWYTVNDSRGLCPQGWHVPSDAEWTTLTSYLGGTSVAGGKMKSVSALWTSPNTDATNNSGFSGLPGGSHGISGSFGGIGGSGKWWLSAEFSSADAWFSNLDYNNGLVNVYYNYKQNGYSVRCLRD